LDPVRVDAWLPRAERRHPARRAVNTLDYATLAACARGAALALTGRRIRPGDRVGLALPPGEDACVALHACLLLGAVAVPIDLRLAAAERAGLAAATALVVDEPLDAAPVAAGDPAASAGPPSQHDLDAVATVVHTSGTSGAPRPVELTYGNWLWSALGSAVALGVEPGDRWLCALPLTHVGGLSIVLRSAIYGTAATVHERFQTERVLAELSDPDGPALVSLVPTTLARLLDAGLRDPPALRWALLGGAPLPEALLRRAVEAGVPVAPTYGLTEACSQVATHGVPLFCTRVSLAEDGEILVSGATVAPAAGPVLRTDDLGVLEGGRLRVVGRRSDTIVSGGENVAPAEVEAVLLAHPAVLEAAVHAREDPEWGEAVVATVVPRPGAVVSAEELRRHCATRLAGFKVPKDVAFAGALPRTASGKLVRASLR
jgi:O-succinylbenzoic acid--CoA ligase